MNHVAPAHLTFSHVSSVLSRAAQSPVPWVGVGNSQRHVSSTHSCLLLSRTPGGIKHSHNLFSTLWLLLQRQAAPSDLFSGRTRTSDPPAMGEEGESSKESTVSKHPICWVWAAEAALGPMLWFFPLVSPSLHVLAGWICGGFVGWGGWGWQEGTVRGSGKEQQGLEQPVVRVVQAGGGTTCKEQNPHEQKLA